MAQSFEGESIGPRGPQLINLVRDFRILSKISRFLQTFQIVFAIFLQTFQIVFAPDF